MHVIKIEVNENRTINCENITAGTTGENEATKLKFIIPKAYKTFYKYLDIVKANGEKTQTVVGDTKDNIFYYTLPYILTEGDELILQLVLKKGNIVFKSGLFSLYFGGSIGATQILEGDYQDTIEFIMENKASKEELLDLNSKVNLKADRNEINNFTLLIGKEIAKKVDKIDGKELSSNDYTNEDREKLITLPTRAEIYNIVADIDDTIEKLISKAEGCELTLAEKADQLYVDEMVGNIASALDELHNYAQALIGGAE